MTREEAITLLKKLRTFHNGTYAKAIDMAIEALSAEAVQGEWTNEDGKPITDKFSVYCSRCKRWSEYRTNYCGHCGTKMGGNTDD